MGRRLLALVWMLAALAGGLVSAARAQSVPAYILASPMLPLVLQMPENGWLRVNTNLFSDVWTPPDLEPLFDNVAPYPPSKIIQPWSGFAWDSNRGDVILYGGGHANYPGNDVYRWHSSTLQWERASLPSEIHFDPVAGTLAIDGVNAAPASSHTYDNNTFLPIADRFVAWGGAVYGFGGPYQRVSETDPTKPRSVGPYLFDPSKADGNKVGGTTGSHVMRVAPHPEIVGGQMWENRDIYLHLAGQPLPLYYTSGCAITEAEGGHDVVYVAADINLNLYRYQLTDIANPTLDQIAVVGRYAVSPAAGQVTCGYDPGQKVFVHTGTNAVPFFFWDLTKAGPANAEQQVQVDPTIAAFQSWLSSQSLAIQNCALKFDPVRGRFPIWCGAGAIWELAPPTSGNTATGWSISQSPAPQTISPPGDTGGTGVLGKFRYAPYYDVFVGLEGPNDGNIWIYKPLGWVQPNPPGNALPTVAITAPTAGTSVAPATPVSLTASAADVDGFIARVEFYVNGTKVGQATSPPFTVGFTPTLVGQYTVIAVAVDNVGGMTASTPVAFTVDASVVAATLQRGVKSYAGVADTYLDGYNTTTNWGASTALYLNPAQGIPLVRFAIFSSEGGPVPDGVVIQSATLALYKQDSYNDTLSLNALLKPWTEAGATWITSQSGAAWSVGGAGGAGTDYDPTPDSLVVGGSSPAWVTFDVTSRMQEWSNDSSTNYGWRLSQTTTGFEWKTFNSSEYAIDPTLRPMLTVVYAESTPATSVSLASSANPSTVGASVTFTATVHGSAPTGSVAFADGGSPMSGCTAVAVTGAGDTRTAQCTTSALNAATHSITAQYGGDAGNSGSTSAPLLQVVNASGPAAPSVTGQVSRKTHGAAGAFDLALSAVSTDPTTEPRTGPTQTVVFQFNKPVVAGTAVISEGTATIQSVTFAANEMTVNMTGVDDRQYVTVMASNVAAADGGTGGSASARIGYLAGDVKQKRVVTVSDLILVNAQITHLVTASNFLDDLNASGAVTVSDLLIVNRSITAALPAP